MLGRHCVPAAALLRPPALQSRAGICRRRVALPRCYAAAAGGNNKQPRPGKIKTSLFADVLDEDGAVKVPAGQGRGLDSSTHPANSKQQKEQGLYRDPPLADKKSAQQVLEAVPNKKPSMWDLPSMAELGAEVRQGVKAAKAPRKGAGSSRFSEAVDAAGQVTGPGTNVKEIFSDSRGTIRDVQSFAQTQGKLPSVYIAADDEPLPFPAMAATNLAEEEVDVAEMVSAGKVSLVGFGFRSSGDPMIKAFSMHWEKTFGADSRTQFLESTVPPERHKLYLNHLVAEDSAAVEALQLNGTRLVGYVRLVGKDGNVRWLAQGIPTKDELAEMIAVTQELLEAKSAGAVKVGKTKQKKLGGGRRG